MTQEMLEKEKIPVLPKTDQEERTLSLHEVFSQGLEIQLMDFAEF